MIKFIVFYITLFATFSACDEPESQSVSAYFEQLARDGEFNGNVLVTYRDSVIYKNSFGFADGKKKTRLSAKHAFGIGSVYKEFPGIGIMQLQESGMLSIKDSIAKFLTYLPDWSRKITIEHLLNYTSGLPTIDFNAYFQSEEGVRQEIILDDLSKLIELDYTPGSEYIYSNYNPMLLIKIIEKVSGIPFKQYIEESVFEPLGVNGITIESEFPFREPANFAIPMNSDFEEDEIAYELTTICATTSGLYNWIKILNDFHVISKQSTLQLSTKFKNKEVNESPLGHCIWSNDQLIRHEHHGSSGNYECLVLNAKEKSVVIILLTNQKQGNLQEIAENVLKQCQLLGY